jgi:hypothetical protein
LLAVKEIKLGVDFQAGVFCACPTDTARREEMIAAGGVGVVNEY